MGAFGACAWCLSLFARYRFSKCKLCFLKPPLHRVFVWTRLFYNQNRILLAFSLKECQIHCTIQKNYLPLPTKQFTPKGHTVSDISIKLTFHALIFSYQTSQLCIYSEDYSNRRHVECIYCLRSPKCIHTFGEMRKLYAYTFGRGLTVLYYPE